MIKPWKPQEALVVKVLLKKNENVIFYNSSNTWRKSRKKESFEIFNTSSTVILL